jgi:hypothetical protein
MAHRTVLVVRANSYLTLWVIATFLTAVVFTRDRASAHIESTPAQRGVVTLDLTKRVPPAEQGFHGIPGGEGGSDAKPPYQLPLQVQVLGTSFGSPDQYAIQATVKNVGTQDFELPISKNLTAVEKNGNKSQRLFFFLVEALPGGHAEPVGVGDAVVGGSANLPNSFLTLTPGESVNVILPVSTDLLERALRGSREEVEVRIFCNEWQLDDSRYFTRATSEKVTSTNSVSFVLRDGKPFTK